MNANELADELDNLPSEYLMEAWMYKAQTMLRKQQSEIDKHKDLIKDLDSLVGVQGQSGTWDYDQYMTGMFNGMELALSIFEDRDPQYRELSDDGV